jgi:hypothetical protein
MMKYKIKHNYFMSRYLSSRQSGKTTQKLQPPARRAETSTNISMPSGIVSLQRYAGNKGVQALLSDSRLQRQPAQTNDPSAHPFTWLRTTSTVQRQPSPAPEPQAEQWDLSSIIQGAGDVSVYAGTTMTSEEALRRVYMQSARKITEDALKQVADGVPSQNAARWAVEARNDLKVQIRSKGSPIVKGLAEARNIRKYGNKVGPSYEQLIREGKTPDDIIGKAGRSSTKVNRLSTTLKVGGRVLIAVDLAIVTWEVFSAPEGERLRTAVGGAGGLAGAAAGGWAGAKAGGAIGSLFGPVGTAVGGVIGGIGGAIIGGIFGRKAATKIYDVIDELGSSNSEWENFVSGIELMEAIRFQREVKRMRQPRIIHLPREQPD